MDPSVGHLNGILVRIGGNLNNNFAKSQMLGGLPGGDVEASIWLIHKLTPLQNGNLKKAHNIIDLSRNILLMTHMTFLFLKVFWIGTNTVNVRGTDSINMNEPKDFN